MAAAVRLGRFHLPVCVSRTWLLVPIPWRQRKRIFDGVSEISVTRFLSVILILARFYEIHASSFLKPPQSRMAAAPLSRLSRRKVLEDRRGVESRSGCLYLHLKSGIS